MSINEAKISDDLRTIAFDKAVELLAGQSASPSKRAPVALPGGKATGATGDEPVVLKIARKLALPAEAVAEIYSEDEHGGVQLVVGVGKLDTATAAATKQLALLVSGGRQLAEVEEWTSTKTIRQVCVHYGRFDRPNFAKTLKQMDEAFSFKGKGQQLDIRLHQRGIDRLKRLITSLTGGMHHS